MPAAKFSVSISKELEQALTRLAAGRLVERSPLIEMLLREHPLVREQIEELRNGPRTKKGRPIDKLLVLGRVGGSEWERKVASGQIKLVPRRG